MHELPHDLATIQRWMQSVIVHPHGVAAGLRSDEAQQHLDVSEANIDEVIAPSQALTSLERLSIYSHAYTARLLECLRAAYPTLSHTLGYEAFDALALGYLQACPSQSYTLDKLGARFAEFLEETRPDRREVDDGTLRRETRWPDFLIELARFDWAVGEVFDGPGAEGQTLLTAAQIAAFPVNEWPNARLLPAPSLRLLSFRYPVNEYFSAVRTAAEPSVPDPRETYLALTRRDYIVCRHDLSAAPFAVVSALVAGRTVGQAIARGATAIARGATVGEFVDDESFAAELRNWFRYWTANEFFSSLA